MNESERIGPSLEKMAEEIQKAVRMQDGAFSASDKACREASEVAAEALADVFKTLLYSNDEGRGSGVVMQVAGSAQADLEVTVLRATYELAVRLERIETKLDALLSQHEATTDGA